MTTSDFRSIGLIVNSQKPEAYPLAEALVPWLRERDRTVLADAGLAQRVSDSLPQGQSIAEVAAASDMLVVFGGDGTLLNVASQLEGRDAPIFGVKMGGLGFLTEVMEDEVRSGLEAVFEGRGRFTQRTLLEATIEQTPAGTLGPFPALNDVVIARDSPARIVTLETWADGRPLSTFLCDGLILATPTGSTAHNMAAGGPIIDPGASVFVLTPICPHTLTVRPLVLRAETEITVQVQSADAAIHVLCDGQELAVIGHEDRVIIRQAAHRITTVGSNERDYYSILRTKLKWGER